MHVYFLFRIQENFRWDFATTLMQCSQVGNTPSLVYIFEKCWECMSPCTSALGLVFPLQQEPTSHTYFVVVMHLRQNFAQPWTIGNRQTQVQNTGTNIKKPINKNSIKHHTTTTKNKDDGLGMSPWSMHHANPDDPNTDVPVSLNMERQTYSEMFRTYSVSL